jgi:hypothetical protein
MGIEASHGIYQWVTPVGEVAHYQATSVANGVVYAIDAGFNAESGAPVVTRSLGADVGDDCVTLGGGIAIARHTVLVACDTGATGGSWLVGYGLRE